MVRNIKFFLRRIKVNLNFGHVNIEVVVKHMFVSGFQLVIIMKFETQFCLSSRDVEVVTI